METSLYYDSDILNIKQFYYQKNKQDIDFKNLNYDMDFKNKYIAETGCVVEEYDISKRKELEDWKEEPYFDLLTNVIIWF